MTAKLEELDALLKAATPGELAEKLEALERTGRAYLFANFEYANAAAELVEGEPPTSRWHQSLAKLGAAQAAFTQSLNEARAALGSPPDA